jgi:glucosamine--fructose-6-phosphate aminotransferase (isomerizing)
MTDTLRGRVSLEHGGRAPRGRPHDRRLRAGLDRIVIICACGTAWHAGLVGKNLIEGPPGCRSRSTWPASSATAIPSWARTRSSSRSASRVRRPTRWPPSKRPRRRGARILSVCNVIDSSIARASDDLIYTHAGPEIGVASTKAFMTQMLALQLLAVWLGRGGARCPEATRAARGARAPARRRRAAARLRAAGAGPRRTST